MTMHVVSYNILAQAHIRRDEYPHSSDDDLAAAPRLARLLARVAGMGADLYLLQEVEPDTYDAISAALGAGFAGHYACRPGRPDGCAVLYRTARFSAPEWQVLPFGDRLSIVGQLTCDGRRLTVACTHLRWQRSRTPAEEHLGLQQLTELMDRLPAEGPTLLGGDFNALSLSPPLEAALARGYRLGCRSQRPWDTVNINGRCRKIDYLLYTPGALAAAPGVLPRLRRDTPMPSATEPSDHLPVSVHFSWKEDG